MTKNPALRLDPVLLATPALADEPGRLNATLGAHGLYSTFQFVLRLSPAVHRKLADLPTGIVNNRTVGLDGAEAFSTLLHETIHWWQHVGSTYGFLMSLSFPAEAHGNHRHLKKLAATAGFKKSVRQLAGQLDKPLSPETPAGLANIIINNQFDFDAFRRFTYSAQTRQAVVQDIQFESAGHAFHMTYGKVMTLLAATADPACEVVTHPSKYDTAFRALTKAKEPGFFYGSPVTVMPIGALEIMEGQARFSQIQFLHFASGGNLEWDSFRSLGMLEEGVYRAAFDRFLIETKFDWPASVDDPIVGLFLLICDMALNPGAMFPLDLRYPSSFIDDVDPGTRFAYLSCVVRLKCPQVAKLIKTYSREEYAEVSRQLSEALKVDAPLEIAAEVASWPTKSAGIKSLMTEYETFQFGSVNQPLRVMFSHFIAFMADKLARPEFFCWPGVWLVGDRIGDHTAALFDRHGALFVDKEDDDGVFPRLRQDRDEAAIHTMFDDFYAVHATYDMTQQWITEPGPFRYDYRWLVQNASADDMKSFADRHFHMVFDLWPDDAELLAES